jgi:hypothetical protein
MKRIREFVRKLKPRPAVREDAYAEEIRRAMGGLKTKTEEFAGAVQSFAVQQATADLLRRIEALEKEIRAMKNGAGEFPKISL